MFSAPISGNLETLVPKAEGGDINAQYEAGLLLFKQKKFQTAFKWFSQSAAGGNVNSLTFEAQYYQHGYNTVQIDLPKCFELYKRAAEGGNSEAQISLALCYRDGDGTKTIQSEFEKWLQKAVEGNHPYAKINAIINPESDLKPYLAKLQESGDAGDVNSYFRLGICYVQCKGTSQDVSKAFELYEKASADGHAGATVNLGMRYLKGEGVEKDPLKAIELFRKAASQNCPNAINNIGVRFLKGDAFVQGVDQALEHLTKAALLGNVQAQVNLGDSYRNGDQLPRSYRKAKKWYSMAAEHGNKFCADQIESPLFIQEIEKEIEDANRRWKTIRLFFIASKDKGCPAGTLPVEILKHILKYVKL
jgi:TPR repeat protein